MEVSTAESSAENERNRIYPSKEGRSSSEVDEISEEAEYKNIHDVDGTPEYENEARMKDEEDDGLGSQTDVSTGSTAWKNIKEQKLHCPGCIDQRENPASPSIHNIDEQAIQPQLKQTTCHLCWGGQVTIRFRRCGMLQHRKSQTEVANTGV